MKLVMAIALIILCMSHPYGGARVETCIGGRVRKADSVAPLRGCAG